MFVMIPTPSYLTISSSPSHALAEQPSTVPVLHAGDTWNYQYSGPEGNSGEKIVRSEACGSAQCVIDQEANQAWNDTVWLSQDWALSREYYVDHSVSYNSSTSYTPGLQLYQFPLEAGKSWWSNGTATGWYTDQNGNHTFGGPNRFSILRRVINQTTVNVPAGSFDTFLVAEYVKNGTELHEYRWFSLQAKTTAKLQIFNSDTGALVDSYVMTSYNLVTIQNPSPAPNPSPTPSNPSILGLDPKLFYSVVGSLLAIIVLTVAIVLVSKKKKPTFTSPKPPAN